MAVALAAAVCGLCGTVTFRDQTPPANDEHERGNARINAVDDKGGFNGCAWGMDERQIARAMGVALANVGYAQHVSGLTNAIMRPAARHVFDRRGLLFVRAWFFIDAGGGRRLAILEYEVARGAGANVRAALERKYGEPYERWAYDDYADSENRIECARWLGPRTSFTLRAPRVGAIEFIVEACPEHIERMKNEYLLRTQ
jgi:hypothetical protein